ncbi:hypothetical protein PCASD_01444 [Puccinia coronata f. sp. avenae]|uniref:Protein DSF2 n=1 Tax=Puccinia coronata f. sp. avenae TaxID=200324 RepID=A0A2N5VKB9_9BASI|nr:hypothetical protein PCASD_01444 [Puccinia coronata f. sp. avenae]
MERKSTKTPTLRKSASAYLRRKLSSKKAPSRATTLPAEASKSKPSKDTCATLLHPTKLCENPRKILHDVAEFFSNEANLGLHLSHSASTESTPSTSSCAQSPVGNSNPSFPQRLPSSCPRVDRVCHSQTWPSSNRPSLGRLNSDPAQESKPTLLDPYPARHSSHLRLDLSRCEDSITATKFCNSPVSIVKSPKQSPLSKEIICEIEESDPLPISSQEGKSKVLPGLHGKPNEVKPRLATDVKSKFEKSIPGEKQILHRGIVAHQNNDMTLSAILFEKCAKENGGCGVGMLMWALALRHGWGCPVDTLKAFGWLQLSIKTLLTELHDSKLEKQHYDEIQSLEKPPKDPLLNQYLISEIKGIKAELLLALYELGQCLMYGWGTHRDKHLAVQYYHLAATLGDPDAQKELAYCYEVGNGVKRNSRNAAKYYRMACAQGIKMMGYQWIWKEKYDPIHK